MDDQAHNFYQLTRQIAAQLSETQPTPLGQIRRMLHTIGPERTQAFVEQALEVEAQGGMLLPDGSRKRTLGGVFFRLVRDQVSDAERRAIWPYPSWQQRKQRAKAPATLTPPQLPPFQWEQVDEVITAAISHPGEASTVKVTIIGRPGEIVERQGVIILALQNTTPPSLPKGLPAPPTQPTNYLVFVSQKQWKRVAEALQNPEDKLIIEGYPVHYPRFTGITVYATQVTTTRLQAAKRHQTPAN
ncbi:MAG: phosphorylated adapter RNA export RNA-binding domain-containing protein [Chloroflexota bacterium]|nr:phosphorylated adapter RNA export RNA-binding domain-containing protein [Chloroflexota bacterium]